MRDETWLYRGEGTERAVDYLLGKYSELTSQETKEKTL